MTSRDVLTCAHCGVVLDGHDDTKGDDVAHVPPGSVLACLYCGRPSIVGPTGPRSPVAGEWAELAHHDDLLNFMAVWMEKAAGDGWPKPEERGGRKMPKFLGGGFYADDDGTMHVDLPQYCVALKIRPTPANQNQAAERVAADLRRRLPGAAIEVHDDGGTW